MLDASDITPYSLSDKFDLTQFENENPKFVKYLCEEASKDQESNVGRVFLFIHNADYKIVGYVTLAMSHVPKKEHIKLKGVTRYSNIPALLLGQMARDSRYNHMGAGRLMLDWVINQGVNLSKIVGCRLILLHSVPEKVKWYQSNNFILLENTQNSMFLDLFK